MTEPSVRDETWDAANGRFLAASLDWLRLLLRRRIDGRTSVADEHRRLPRWFGRTAAATTDPATPDDSDDQIALAAEAVRDAEAVTPPPALVTLAAELGLSRFERDTLLLAAATELDPTVAELCALAQGNDRLACPTFGLALSLLPDPAWEVVSPHRGLRFWRLVEITQQAGYGLIGAPLRADERIVNYLKGMNHLDNRLAPLVEQLGAGFGRELPASQQAVVAEVVRHWQQPGTAGPVVQLVGTDDAGKQLVATWVAGECGVVACRLPAALLPVQPAELDELARLWLRESTLLPLALYVHVDDADDTGTHPPVARFLSRMTGRTIFAARESWPDVGRESLVLDVEPPTPAERAQAWRAAFGGSTSDAGAVDSLAAQFGLELSTIQDIAAVADGSVSQAWRACRVRTRPRLDALAQRLETRVVWDDIVLPAESRQALERIADQVAHRTMVYETWGFGERVTRGLGLSALFSGPSGAGKTMAAEVLANHLKLDLYRIDLSAVVSKYIGETEKNLRRLFDAADGGGSILFFDEADSLFGKRSEVKDAHDRYANIEVNYLLQRMEAYRGLAILATNMRGALDNAFLRRLRFIVEFQFPGPEQRRTIGEKAFPAGAPRDELDYDRLAQLQVSGGMTRNIALNAAFLAASAGSPIGMRHVLDAARSEFQKLELPIRERDFVWDKEHSR